MIPTLKHSGHDVKQSPALKHPVILLAGGQSARMGTPKTLLTHSSFRGYWIEEQIRKLHACGIERVIIVLGFHAQTELSVLEPLDLGSFDMGSGHLVPTPFRQDVTVVVNPRPKLGPFSSLVSGVQALLSESNSPESGAFVLPIDVPAPGCAIWANLQSALSGVIAVTVPVHANKGGHPVLLSSRFVHTLLTVQLDSTEARLDRQIERLESTTVRRVDTLDSSVCLNLNHPHDWDRYVVSSVKCKSDRQDRQSLSGFTAPR